MEDLRAMKTVSNNSIPSDLDVIFNKKNRVLIQDQNSQFFNIMKDVDTLNGYRKKLFDDGYNAKIRLLSRFAIYAGIDISYDNLNLDQKVEDFVRTYPLISNLRLYNVEKNHIVDGQDELQVNLTDDIQVPVFALSFSADNFPLALSYDLLKTKTNYKDRAPPGKKHSLQVLYQSFLI